MKVLITAGNTLVPIDRVRCITSVFSGRTGAGLAVHAHERGHQVTLLTSHPEVVGDGQSSPQDKARWRCLTYRTFNDLERLMEQEIAHGFHDAIIASAAVSDFRAEGIYAPAADTHFSLEDNAWRSDTGTPTLCDRTAGKVKSDEPELWLRLVRTPKLIDRVRADWGFQGLLVKFKLEVDLKLEQLLDVAEKSRQHSRADWMVANLYDGVLSSFWVGPFPKGYECVGRLDLPTRLFDLLETQQRERSHG